MRLRRRRNQIETFEPVLSTKQRSKNKSYNVCTETPEVKESNGDIGCLIRLSSSQVFSDSNMGKQAKQRTSFRCFFTGFRFKSKVDLQDRVYLDYVPCDKIVKFVCVISQRKTQESKEDIIIVKLSSIYQTGSLTLVVFEEAVSCIASL